MGWKLLENGWKLLNKSGIQAPRNHWGWEVHFYQFSTNFNIFMVFCIIVQQFLKFSASVLYVGFVNGCIIWLIFCSYFWLCDRLTQVYG